MAAHEVPRSEVGVEVLAAGLEEMRVIGGEHRVHTGAAQRRGDRLLPQLDRPPRLPEEVERPAQDVVARRHARQRAGDVTIEPRGSGGETIEVRGVELVAAVRAEHVPVERVEEHDDDVLRLSPPTRRHRPILARASRTDGTGLQSARDTPRTFGIGTATRRTHDITTQSSGRHARASASQPPLHWSSRPARPTTTSRPIPSPTTEASGTGDERATRRRTHPTNRPTPLRRPPRHPEDEPPAITEDRSYYILPPGNFGGLPKTDESTDQLALYDGLTPLRDDVTDEDIENLFLPQDFEPIGETTEEPTGRPGTTILYDEFGIRPHHGRDPRGHGLRRRLGHRPRPRAADRTRPGSGAGRGGRRSRHRRVLAGHERADVHSRARRPNSSSPTRSRSSSTSTATRARRSSPTPRPTPTA